MESTTPHHFWVTDFNNYNFSCFPAFRVIKFIPGLQGPLCSGLKDQIAVLGGDSTKKNNNEIVFIKAADPKSLNQRAEVGWAARTFQILAKCFAF